MAAMDDRLADTASALSEPLPPLTGPSFAEFVDRYAEAKVILLGESTHGTDEFYRARALMTERLVIRHGFTVVAVEADWPDAARIDAYVMGHERMPAPITPFQRFPTWMWRNQPVRAFVDRLHEINETREDRAEKVGFYGLDLYSLPSSMDAVIQFVERHDPSSLDEVRDRYGCLAPFIEEPAAYGALAHRRRVDTCSEEVIAVIDEVLKKRLDHIEASDRAFFDALQNARVVASSEAYYRAMYEGSAVSWNLRDTHMFETLRAVLDAREARAKAVVWAHNSHIGDASATSMGMMGETNLGELCREAYGEKAVLIGFGTDRGTVRAASQWGGQGKVMNVRPSLADSWDAVMRQAGPERFLLDMRNADEDVRKALRRSRPERFIGVIYRPETERISHYAEAALADQFDAYVWFERSSAVEPLPAVEVDAMPATYPFAL